MDSDWMETLPELVNEEPIRVRPSAPLVLPRPSEKVQLSLKNQCLQRFLRPESSEVVR